MISPLHIITIGLGVGFALGLIKKAGATVTGIVTLTALMFMSVVSAQWAYSFVFEANTAIEIFTAGFEPPYSINLRMGLNEAVITLLINVVGLLSGLFMLDVLKKQGVNTMIIFIVFIMSLNVVVMTRDLFNLFVFLEVSSIATAGLVLLDKNIKSISAGFKYMIATGFIAGIFLLGIIFAYYFGGSLNIEDLSVANLLAIKGGSVVLFLIFIAIILELKPFPANGWALDVYQAARPGLAAVISAGTATAVFYVLYKILPLAGEAWYMPVAITGLITFLGANMLGIKQKNTNRLLGYSSIGQIGLLLIILGLSPYLDEKLTYIAGAIIFSHYLAKAGLFWLSGIVQKETIKEWAIIRKKPLMLFVFGTLIFALIGFPPFPSFFGKWELIMALSDNGMFAWFIVILLGSFFEAIYLFRWFGYAVKLDNANLPDYKLKIHKIIPVAIFVTALYVVGYTWGNYSELGQTLNYIPLLFVVVLLLLDFLPVFIKNTLSIAGVLYYSYLVLPHLEEYRLIFGIIFMAGAVLTLLAGYSVKGKRPGFYPLTMLMYAGLIGLVEAENILQFFFAWEIMTAGSYFLIIRGKKSMPHALSYMLFSLAGAYLILAGLGIAHFGQNDWTFAILQNVSTYAPLVFILLAVGFMTKTASLGLHIWLPGAHSEAESDVSPMVSGVLLKAGVFGLIILLLAMGRQHIGSLDLVLVLSWIGAISALTGNVLAAFEEDAKRLLAYSSIGQLGYILFGLSLMSNLGWLAAIALSVMHFLYKTLLFQAIGGVVTRTKERNMYKMGGLIQRMPYTFISVLMGIIALSGVPPLAGFGGKWIFFNAIVLEQYYLQGTVVVFAGVVAFLYLFRLIHTIFLGQLKDNHRQLKEAPIWMLVPQYIILTFVMAFSMVPGLLLERIGKVLATTFPENALVWKESFLSWGGKTAHSPLGYWNGTYVMIIAMGIFMIVLAWILIIGRRNRQVKQFNIVYAAERPSTPETTHFAYNFFAPYNKALGFIAAPWISNFWNSVSDATHAIADKIRAIYNGNGQTYILHLVLFVVVFYLIIV